MAKKTNSLNHLPLETVIEVIAKKDKEIHKIEMKFGEWLRMKQKQGWNYSAYQKGFSAFKTINKNEL